MADEQAAARLGVHTTMRLKQKYLNQGKKKRQQDLLVDDFVGEEDHMLG